jgi:acyl carrier protein
VGARHDRDASLHWASVDFLNLVTALHDETGIEVPERDYPRLATLDGFVAYVIAAPSGKPT